MAMGTSSVTIPAFAAAAAAVGIYLLDTSHYSKVQEFKGVAPPVPIGSVLNKAKKDANNIQLLELSPQFDGLNCFETLVGCY